MEIIPVIDIRHGQVVHAVEGQRQNYRPLQTTLSNSIDPQAIVQAFINTYPFKTIYIADLDAIEGRTNNDTLITELHRLFPLLTFWIDQGVSSSKELKKHLSQQQVIGSETNISCASLQEITDLHPDIILSLDYQSNTFLGDQDLFKITSAWPERIIAMSLARVGADNGPDYKLVSSLKKIIADRKLYVAGGVRNEDDLQRLYETGIDGVLIASALHTQNVTAKMLEKYSKKMPRKRGI